MEKKDSILCPDCKHISYEEPDIFFEFCPKCCMYHDLIRLKLQVKKEKEETRKSLKSRVLAWFS